SDTGSSPSMRGMSAGQGECMTAEKAPSASLRSAPPSSREDSVYRIGYWKLPLDEGDVRRTGGVYDCRESSLRLASLSTSLIEGGLSL
ncbi:MAG: hypothetical protein Q4B28_05590, partial [bacterium]|nr:hypothetical protein [bacterium]